MIAWDFSPAYEALRARLEADLSDVVFTVTRRNLPARHFPPEAQPAVCIVEDGGGPLFQGDRPVAYELNCLLALHVQTSAEDEAPGDRLLSLAARIEKALQWRPGEPKSEDGYWTTLGGKVRWARIGPWDPFDDPGRDTQVTEVFEVSMLVTP